MDMTKIGPTIWAGLHLLCLSAPHELDSETHSQFVSYISSLKSLIPCKDCRTHFSQILLSNPVPISDIFTWSVNIHNIVNESLGKPILDCLKARKFWEKYSRGKRCSQCSKSIDPLTYDM